jgi:hypothetical protein
MKKEQIKPREQNKRNFKTEEINGIEKRNIIEN